MLHRAIGQGKCLIIKLGSIECCCPSRNPQSVPIKFGQKGPFCVQYKHRSNSLHFCVRSKGALLVMTGDGIIVGTVAGGFGLDN